MIKLWNNDYNIRCHVGSCIVCYCYVKNPFIKGFDKMSNRSQLTEYSNNPVEYF